MTKSDFPRPQRFPVSTSKPMSFGRPPSINIGFKPTPPERGSFPLDHYGSALMSCRKPVMDFLSRRGMQGEDEALHVLFEAKWEHIESLSGT